MAKYCGMIGFAETVETSPGVWTPQITERKYYGDLNRNSRRLQSANQVNDNIVISNELSIVADKHAIDNFHAIRYAMFKGVKWKVETAELQYPRLILTLGGEYNG